MTRVRIGFVTAMASTSLCLASPVFAQQGWGTGIILSNDIPDVPHVAVNASGTTIVVWASCTGAPPENCNIATAVHARGGAWLITTGITAPGTYRAPEAAVDPEGNMIVVWEHDSVIEAIRYRPEAGWQLPPVTLSTAGARDPHVGIDAAGDALAIWIGPGGINDQFEVVHYARYTRSTDSWSSASSLSPVDINDPHLAVDAAGNAMVVWGRTVGSVALVEARRYSVATGTWGYLEVPTATSSSSIEAVRVLADTHGNVTAIWHRVNGVSDEIVAARYSSAANSWLGERVLSAPPADAGFPEATVDEAGNVTVVWTRFDLTVEGARFSIASGAWFGPVALTDPYTFALLPNVAADAAGNTTFAWIELTETSSTLRVARFTAAGQFLPASTIPADEPVFAHLVADAGGNVTLVWEEMPEGDANTSLHAVRWEGAPAAPLIRSALPGDGALVVAFSDPATSEALFAPLNYEYSTDFGSTWTTRTPPSTASPVVVSGLTNGITYMVLLRAVNRAGAGADARVTGTPLPAPGPPSDLRVEALSGNTVTLAWAPSSGGVIAAQYVIEGGIAPGEVLASLPTGTNAARFTFTAPTGAFRVRVHAVSGASRSVASNEIQVFVGVPVAPSAPAHLLGMVDGSALALSWTNTFGGGTPTLLQLHVSGALTTTLSLPPSESFRFPAVPPGTYTVALTAMNASGSSPPSNAVTLTFPESCTGVPGVPTRFVATTTGRWISATWSPPETGAAVTSYMLLVSGTLTDMFPTSGRALAGTVSPGSYTLRVAAVNACGVGPESAAWTVIVQ